MTTATAAKAQIHVDPTFTDAKGRKFISADNAKVETTGQAMPSLPSISERAAAILGKSKGLDAAHAALEAAKEEFAIAGNESSKAQQTAAEAGRILAELQIDGLITATTVSEELGKVFGFKVTDKGKTSKTPDGHGEDIRKRIVRVVDTVSLFSAAADLPGYVAPKFFEGIDRSHFRTVYDAWKAGAVTVWQVYNETAAIKKEHKPATVKSDAAFDPAKVLKLAETIATPAGMALVTEGLALRAAYETLRDVLTVILSVERQGE